MNFAFALFARFESPTVRLEDISDEFFGMEKDKAYQLAAVNGLSVPTFRAGSQKSPRLVHVDDLAKWLDDGMKRPTAGNLVQAALVATKDAIFSAAVPIKGPEGVYFLIVGNEVVYVGQSIDINRRLNSHRRSRKFDRYAWISAPARRMRMSLEAELIRLFKPKWNRAGL